MESRRALEVTGVIPALCPGCRSPVPAHVLKCPWCGRNITRVDWDED
jgi:hypothetical protein